jgi:hypothetical protein
MQRAAAFVFLLVSAIIAPACFGGPTSIGNGGTSVPAVDWTIRYSIGVPAATAADLPHRCPADATCAPVRLQGVSPEQWVLGVTRHVSCPTDRGDITPPADCPAIARLRERLARPRTAACLCPYRPGIRGLATATEEGRRIRVPLDVCSYCPAGRQVAAALETLTRSR